MKTNPYALSCILTALACLILAAPPAGGQVRSGGPYEIACEAADCSGARLESDGGGRYVIDASVGGISGLSTVSIPAMKAKQGYSGQLYDLVGLDVTATPASLDENTSRQLEASAVCDDETLLELDESAVAWSLQSGPIASISTSGLTTAGFVYADTGALVRGTHLGFEDDLLLTVFNVGNDDYGSYAGDDIDDDWQVFYFDEENPDAGPGENPDNDPDDNWSEFLTGFDPTDPLQWFQLRINGHTGTTAQLELNKVIPDRTYTVLAGTDLEEFPETVTTFSVSSEEAPKVVEDPGASVSRKFYRVEVTRGAE